MNTDKMKSNGLSRRRFLTSTATVTATLAFTPSLFAASVSRSKRPDSNFGGVQIGVITYSWRSMPSKVADIIRYCQEGGISSLELMGNVAEDFAGIPPAPPRIPSTVKGDERERLQRDANEAKEKQREWRLSVSMKRYQALRKMFNKAGIKIPIVKFAPAGWTDEEMDYAFKAAKILGATGVSNEIGMEACARMGKFAEKHNMYAVFHNHLQPGEPGFNFDDYLSLSPRNMLNFDAGHYFGATGKHPNEVIERLHKRIFSIHLKDKTGPNSMPANTNTPWGEGETPIADMLKLIQERRWPIYCDIELEYPIPEGSNAQKEVVRCVNYCRDILT